MKSYEAPKPSIQVKKITFSCELCSGPHDTRDCMELPEQAFADYASSRTDGAGDKWYTFKPEPTLTVIPTILLGKITRTLGGNKTKTILPTHLIVTNQMVHPPTVLSTTILLTTMVAPTILKD